jgi:predicted lysophospholipase L1 biosynthesis ABC-type transport system permease subunit
LGDQATPVTVVGESLFPPDVHAEFDEGLWISPQQFDAVVPPLDQANAFQGAERVLVVRFPAGTDAPAAIQAAGDQLGPDTYVAAADLPVELTNLRNVRGLPIALAVFLAVLAIAALSYVLISTSRRRRREIAIFLAMGLDRRSVRSAIHVQATTVAVVGLAFGLVLGIIVGRTVWRLIAEQVPLQVVSPTVIVAVLVLIPITLAVVNIIAILPARRASRSSPAAALRAE